MYVAIDFGAEARRGDNGAAWGYLSVAALGAVACLFLGFLLIARLSQTIGFTSPPPPRDLPQPGMTLASAPIQVAAAPKGGKRAAR